MHQASPDKSTARSRYPGPPPKLFVQNFAMGLRQEARFGHLVFMCAENLSQVLDFLVHAVEHLANRIDFHFAAFEPLQCKAYRQVFR